MADWNSHYFTRFPSGSLPPAGGTPPPKPNGYGQGPAFGDTGYSFGKYQEGWGYTGFEKTRTGGQGRSNRQGQGNDFNSELPSIDNIDPYESIRLSQESIGDQMNQNDPFFQNAVTPPINTQAQLNPMQQQMQDWLNMLVSQFLAT